MFHLWYAPTPLHIFPVIIAVVLESLDGERYSVLCTHESVCT